MRKLAISLALSICVFIGSVSFAPQASATECYRYARSTAVVRILTRESGGEPTADNPKSSAYGCGQLLLATRRAYAKVCGVSPYTNDAEEQMCMMHAYIDDRYGSDARALAFWQRNKYY